MGLFLTQKNSCIGNRIRSDSGIKSCPVLDQRPDVPFVTWGQLDLSIGYSQGTVRLQVVEDVFITHVLGGFKVVAKDIICNLLCLSSTVPELDIVNTTEGNSSCTQCSLSTVILIVN